MQTSEDFDREDDLQDFAQPLLIQTKIYWQWTKRDGLSTSERQLLLQQIHVYVSWYSRERTSKTYREEKKLFKSLFLFSLHTKSLLVAS